MIASLEKLKQRPKQSAMLKLRPYQHIGVSALARGNLILADDVGMGKSAQAITATRLLNADDVVVCTTKTMILTWQNEWKKWWPDFAGSLDVRTYDSLLYSPPPPPSILILDEAHLLKNRKSRRRGAAAKLARKAKRVWCLTATPVQNRVEELWSLLNLVAPREFSSFWRFVQQHANARPGHWGWTIDPEPTNPELLAQETKEYILKRTIAEAGTCLPDIINIPLAVSPSPRQKALHEQIVRENLALLTNDELLWMPNGLAVQTRLRQCAVSPMLLGDDDLGTKVEAVRELIEKLNGRPYVVFSQWLGPLQILQNNGLSDADLLHGGLSQNQRQELLDDWRNGKKQGILAVTRCAGLGIDLTHSDYAIFIDWHFNPEVNNQAIGRLAPMRQKGIKRPVTVHILITEDTIEDWVFAVVGNKAKMTSAIMSAIAKLSRERKGGNGP